MKDEIVRNGCIMPFVALCLEPGGRSKPCCKYSHWIEEPKATAVGLTDLMNAPEFEAVRREFRAGGSPPGCQRCFDDEAAGLDSMRRSFNRLYGHLLTEDGVGLPKAKIIDFGFGNSCNAACVTCGSHASSAWLRDDKKLQAIAGNKFQREARPAVRDAYSWTDEELSGLQVFTFAQTEAMIHPEFEAFVGRAARVGNPKIKRLDISTNGKTFPSDAVLANMLSFGEVELQFSIDGVGERNDYLRYPLKFAEIERNIRRWFALAAANTHLNLSARCTVSILNLLYLDEVQRWWDGLRQETDLGRFTPLQFDYALHPSYLSPTILPQSLRQAAHERFPHPVTAGLRHRQPGAQAPLADFLHFVEALDGMRGLNARSTFPELFEKLRSLS